MGSLSPPSTKSKEEEEDEVEEEEEEEEEEERRASEGMLSGTLLAYWSSLATLWENGQEGVGSEYNVLNKTKLAN